MMPNNIENPYAGISAPPSFNTADFLTQLGIAMTIMSQRDPAKATQLYMGLQGLQQKRQLQQQKQAALVQDRAGMLTLADQIKQVMNTQFTEGTPTTGAEGLRPIEQTGFNQPEAVQGVIPKQLDPAILQQLAAISPSAMKMQMDPQTQTYWQSLGIVPPTPQTLIGQQNAETSQQRAGIAEQIAAIRQQQADTSEGRLKLAQQIQNLETAMAQLQGGAIQSKTRNLDAKTDYTLGMTPLKRELTEEQIKAMQARYPTIAPMEQAKLEGQQARTTQTKKRTQQIGNPKAGKPTEKDKDVEALAAEMRQVGQEQADQMVKKSALLNLGVPNPLHLRAYQRAFGQGQRAPITQGAKKTFRFDAQGNPLP